jgi:hypothetical protein
MRKFLIFSAVVVALAGSTAVAAVPSATGWVIGPTIKGRNYSPGMPLHPSETREGLFQIELPEAPGSVHYVTFRHGSLEGKSRIVLRYRIETARGALVVATTAPSTPGIITPYFQRAGDNWSGRGRFESYRWYATFATQTLTPGEHQIVVPINGNWTAAESSSAASNAQAFREAVRDSDQVGFVLGGGDGYGHGVHATGRARLIVTDFRVD